MLDHGAPSVEQQSSPAGQPEPSHNGFDSKTGVLHMLLLPVLPDSQ